MINVKIYEPVAGIRKQVATLVFVTVPIESEKDFALSPPGIIPVEDVREISKALARNPKTVQGTFGKYEWQED